MQISLQRVAIKSAQPEREGERGSEQLQHKAELESDTQTQVDKKLICIKKRDKKREWVVKVKGVEPRGKLTPWTLTRRRLISIKLKKTHGEFWCCLTVWLTAWLCWHLASKFNELRQVVSLTQIKIMLMNEARARERERGRLSAGTAKSRPRTTATSFSSCALFILPNERATATRRQRESWPWLCLVLGLCLCCCLCCSCYSNDASH